MDDNFLREIAHMYYELNLTQQEIADKIYSSRANVSRFLTEARERGIVEITIRYSFENQENLEKKFHEIFPLSHIAIVNDVNMLTAESYMAVCRMAANYIRKILSNDTVMGISRGRTTQTMVKEFHPLRTFPDMKLIQLSGLMEDENPASFEESDLIRELANKLNCQSYCMCVPAILETRKLRDLIINRVPVQNVMSLSPEINFLCMSVVTLSQWKSHLGKNDIYNLKKNGAIGNLMGYFFDMNGNIIESDLYNRFVMPPKDIFSASRRLAVVADDFKASALLGALRGGLVNEVITNARAARKIIALAEKNNRPFSQAPDVFDN